MGSYEPGELVFSSEPFCHIVKSNVKSGVCDYCLYVQSDENQCSMKQCSGCKLVYYCGPPKNCQNNAQYHLKECMYLQKMAPKVPMDSIRLMGRILDKMENGGPDEYEDLPDGRKRFLKDLITHKEEIKNDKLRAKGLDIIESELKHYLGDETPKKSEIINIYGMIVINSFTIMNNSLNPIGQGLYLAASVLDHSCEPNAIWISNGKELRIRSVKKIEKFEDIRIAYIPLFDRTKNRRKDLMEAYYFRCKCVRCADVKSDRLKSSLLCSNTNCKGCAPFATLTCINCNEKLDQEKIDDYEEIKTQIRNFKVEATEDPEIYETIFRRAVKILHSNDKDLLDLLNIIYERYRFASQHEKCYEIGQLILSNFHQNLPCYDPSIALGEIEASFICNKLNLMEEAEIHVKKAEELLQITHGNDHPLVTQRWKIIRQEIDTKKTDFTACRPQ